MQSRVCQMGNCIDCAPTTLRAAPLPVPATGGRSAAGPAPLSASRSPENLTPVAMYGSRLVSLCLVQPSLPRRRRQSRPDARCHHENRLQSMAGAWLVQDVGRPPVGRNWLPVSMDGGIPQLGIPTLVPIVMEQKDMLDRCVHSCVMSFFSQQ